VAAPMGIVLVVRLVEICLAVSCAERVTGIVRVCVRKVRTGASNSAHDTRVRRRIAMFSVVRLVGTVLLCVEKARMFVGKLREEVIMSCVGAGSPSVPTPKARMYV